MKCTALLSAAVGFAAASPVSYSRSTQCNGSPDLCDRIYSNITFIGTHDSAFVGPIIELTVNQEVSLTDQMNSGIRFLQSQTHLDPFGFLSMCHTSCFLKDSGSVEDYLSEVKAWMDANPGEVMTILLTNGDNVEVQLFDQAFIGSGLKKYAYTPPSPSITIDEWPTLGEMIANDNRLVVFLDYNANQSQVPYILSEFRYMFETPYDTTDPTFPQCLLNRPPGGSPDGKMYLVNHFLDVDIAGADVPDNLKDFQTNAATGIGSIGSQANLCIGKYGRNPNFVLVDMFNRGNVFAAQKALNFPPT